MNTIMKEYIDNLENFNKEEFLKILNELLDLSKKYWNNLTITSYYCKIPLEIKEKDE